MNTIKNYYNRSIYHDYELLVSQDPFVGQDRYILYKLIAYFINYEFKGIPQPDGRRVIRGPLYLWHGYWKKGSFISFHLLNLSLVWRVAYVVDDKALRSAFNSSPLTSKCSGSKSSWWLNFFFNGGVRTCLWERCRWFPGSRGFFASTSRQLLRTNMSLHIHDCAKNKSSSPLFRLIR